MNRALPMFAKLVGLALITFFSTAWANEEKGPTAADPAKGSTLYSNGDASRGVLACVACHGAAGNSTITQNPKLAGQHAAYLQKQLHEFKGPTRNNAVMTGIAKALGDIARAKGMSQVAKDAGLSRESLYKALSGERSPSFDTILKVMGALGLELRAQVSNS